MASLADFCKGRNAVSLSMRNPWLFPDRRFVAVSNGFLILARRARRGDRLKPAPPEVHKLFDPYLGFKFNWRSPRVRIRELRRWCGRGVWPKEQSICRPGRVQGRLINRNWLALLLGRVTDAWGHFEILKTETGHCFSLVTKNWKVHLMGLMETALEEGETVPAFRV